MNLYLWRDVDELTESYHSGGGLLVIAHDEADARELLSHLPHVQVSEEEWKMVRILELAGSPAPEVVVLPDAGCC